MIPSKTYRNSQPFISSNNKANRYARTRSSMSRDVRVERDSFGTYGFSLVGQQPCHIESLTRQGILSGLRPADCILAINGKDARKWSHERVIEELGRSRYAVNLTVLHTESDAGTCKYSVLGSKYQPYRQTSERNNIPQMNNRIRTRSQLYEVVDDEQDDDDEDCDCSDCMEELEEEKKNRLMSDELDESIGHKVFLEKPLMLKYQQKKINDHFPVPFTPLNNNILNRKNKYNNRHKDVQHHHNDLKLEHFKENVMDVSRSSTSSNKYNTGRHDDVTRTPLRYNTSTPKVATNIKSNNDKKLYKNMGLRKELVEKENGKLLGNKKLNFFLDKPSDTKLKVNLQANEKVHVAECVDDVMSQSTVQSTFVGLPKILMRASNNALHNFVDFASLNNDNNNDDETKTSFMNQTLREEVVSDVGDDQCEKDDTIDGECEDLCNNSTIDKTVANNNNTSVLSNKSGTSLSLDNILEDFAKMNLNRLAAINRNDNSLTKQQKDCKQYNSNTALPLKHHSPIKTSLSTDDVRNNPAQNPMLKDTGNEENKIQMVRSMSLLRLDPLTQPRIQSWGMSFGALMHDNLGRKCFMSFLKSEFCEENLLFWQACRSFNELCANHQTPLESLKLSANQIYQDHLAPNSPQPINVDHFVKKSIEEKLQEINDHDTSFKTFAGLFDVAMDHIYTLLRQDKHRRFKTCTMYEQMKMKEEAGQCVEKIVSETIEVDEVSPGCEDVVTEVVEKKEESKDNRRKSLLNLWSNKRKSLAAKSDLKISTQVDATKSKTMQNLHANSTSRETLVLPFKLKNQCRSKKRYSLDPFLSRKTSKPDKYNKTNMKNNAVNKVPPSETEFNFLDLLTKVQSRGQEKGSFSKEALQLPEFLCLQEEEEEEKEKEEVVEVGEYRPDLKTKELLLLARRGQKCEESIDGLDRHSTFDDFTIRSTNEGDLIFGTDQSPPPLTNIEKGNGLFQ